MMESAPSHPGKRLLSAGDYRADGLPCAQSTVPRRGVSIHLRWLVVLLTIASVRPLAATETESGMERAVSAVLPRVVKLYGLKTGTQAGYGSGVLISRDGLVLTVYSLLIDAQRLRAVTSDGTRCEADVAYADPGVQLALLKLRCRQSSEGDSRPGGKEEPGESVASSDSAASGDESTLTEGPDFPFFDLQCESPAGSTCLSELKIGDWVLAAGNPFKVAEGLEPASITRGVFSLRTRLDARRGVKDFPYRGDVLVVDAITSNPGAPGSAVVNLDGCLIGIVGREVVSNQTHTHFNYAVPLDVLCEFVKAAREARPADGESGVVRRTRPRSAESASRQQTNFDVGLRMSRAGYQRALPFVERVARDSPAARAGVQSDDLILAVNGRNVADVDEFDRRLTELSDGESLDLLIRRDRRILNVRIERTEGSRP